MGPRKERGSRKETSSRTRKLPTFIWQAHCVSSVHCRPGTRPVNRVLRSRRATAFESRRTVFAGSGISAAWSEWLEGCTNTARLRLITPPVKRRQAARGIHWDLFRERVAKKTRIKVNRGKVA